MESTSSKPTIIAGYISNGKVFIITKESAKRLEEYETLKKQNAHIPLKHTFELMDLKKQLLPLTEFYESVESNKDNMLSCNAVEIVITNSRYYLMDVNKYFTPLIPGYYLLFKSEPTYEYSLRCTRGKLTIVICPSKNDTIISELTSKLK